MPLGQFTHTRKDSDAFRSHMKSHVASLGQVPWESGEECGSHLISPDRGGQQQVR